MAASAKTAVSTSSVTPSQYSAADSVPCAVAEVVSAAVVPAADAEAGITLCVLSMLIEGFSLQR